MTIAIAITLVLISFTLILLSTNKVSVDLSALIILILLGITDAIPGIDLLPANALFIGFSSSAVIAIIAVMILAAGIQQSGLIRLLAAPISRHTNGHYPKKIGTLGGISGLISAFTPNVGAMALFMPLISVVGQRTRIAISRLLMPTAFIIMLGGCLTLVGSGPLLLLNDILPSNIKPFGMFEPAAIGLPLFIVGIVFFSIAGGWLFPTTQENNTKSTKKEFYSRVYGINPEFRIFKVSAQSSWVGLNIGTIEAQHPINIIALQDEAVVVSPHRDLYINDDDCVALVGDDAAINALIQQGVIEPGSQSKALQDALQADLGSCWRAREHSQKPHAVRAAKASRRSRGVQ